MRTPTAEEREDARIERSQVRQERQARARIHPWRPDCDCEECDMNYYAVAENERANAV